MRRADIEAYITFCEAPPAEWVGTQKVARFIEQAGARVPNSTWRPFTATVSKALRRQGHTPDPHKHMLSQNALKEIFAILSSFYNFLIQAERTEVNPIAHIRQKSKFLRKVQGKPKIRRLSELQWQYVIDVARDMAAEDPNSHERTLFIMSAFYLMYLRISELTASDRWTPKMGDFYRDHDGLWWFTTVGKGNKERHVAVSDAMLAALKRYRHSMNLPALPAPTEYAPLIPKQRGRGPVSNTSHIRKIVQHCFDRAIQKFETDGLNEEAHSLLEATVHWLRHTGISEDVKIRPREHVRDDAGHSSSAITDRYIDVELRERHASAKKKNLTPLA